MDARFFTVFFALVLLQQVLETTSFLGDAKIQPPQEVDLRSRRVKLVLSLQVCDHTQQLCPQMSKGLGPHEVALDLAPHTPIKEVSLVSIKNQCCACLMLVSSTSLICFSIFFLSCLIFRLRPLCAKKVTSISPSFKRVAICSTLEDGHHRLLWMAWSVLPLAMSTPSNCIAATDHDNPFPIKQTVLPLKIA